MRINLGYLFISLVFGLAITYSCASSRAAKRKEECKRKIPDKELQAILFKKDTIPFKDFYTRIGVDIKSEKINNWFVPSIKMRVDSAFSGTIKVLQVVGGTYLITQDSLIYVNKIDKCYFREHLSYLSTVVGTEIQYDFFQDLLLGLPIGLDKSMTYKQIKDPEYYVLSSHKKSQYRRVLQNGNLADPDDIYIQYMMNCKNFDLERIKVQMPADTVEMEVYYKDKKMESGYEVPNITHIFIKHPRDSVKIEINSGIVKIDSPKKIGIKINKDYNECP